MTPDSRCLLCAGLVSRQNLHDLNILKCGEIKKNGLATALSDRAKPIPKIVARASEVFYYKDLAQI